jgi:hypothetical protein
MNWKTISSFLTVAPPIPFRCFTTPLLFTYFHPDKF